MVDIGQEIGTILAEGDSFADQFEKAAEVSAQENNGLGESPADAASNRRDVPDSPRRVPPGCGNRASVFTTLVSGRRMQCGCEEEDRIRQIAAIRVRCV